MAQQRLPMRKIRDVLRLSAAGLSKRQIAASLGIGPTAAGACLRRAREAGVGWPLPDDLSSCRCGRWQSRSAHLPRPGSSPLQNGEHPRQRGRIDAGIDDDATVLPDLDHHAPVRWRSRS